MSQQRWENLSPILGSPGVRRHVESVKRVKSLTHKKSSPSDTLVGNKVMWERQTGKDSGVVQGPQASAIVLRAE